MPAAASAYSSAGKYTRHVKWDVLIQVRMPCGLQDAISMLSCTGCAVNATSDKLHSQQTVSAMATLDLVAYATLLLSLVFLVLV